MSKPIKAKYLKATSEERTLIARLTAKPVFERLDAGDVEIVSSDDWSDVPQLEEHVSVRIPKNLYQKVAKASRKRHTTPERLTIRWLSEHVNTA
jgi:hypothetical protein